MRWERDEKRWQFEASTVHMWELKGKSFSKLEWNDLNSFFFSSQFDSISCRVLQKISGEDKKEKIEEKLSWKKWCDEQEWKWWTWNEKFVLIVRKEDFLSCSKFTCIIVLNCKEWKMWYFYFLHSIKDQHLAVNIYTLFTIALLLIDL